MTSIARLELTSPIMESCEESTRADMLAYFRLWLLTVFEDLVALMPGTGAVSAEVGASKVGGGRILCVYESGRTSVLEALRRIGFGDDSLDAHFHDMPIPPGKNSNLMETIETLAEQHSHLLYARDGLRHTSSAVEAKFGNRMFKARTAARVASMFKSSLT